MTVTRTAIVLLPAILVAGCAASAPRVILTPDSDAAQQHAEQFRETSMRCDNEVRARYLVTKDYARAIPHAEVTWKRYRYGPNGDRLSTADLVIEGIVYGGTVSLMPALPLPGWEVGINQGHYLEPLAEYLVCMQSAGYPLRRVCAPDVASVYCDR
jgi:hypothetical protein